jgi:tetratricopeptide (TPR) repeat protein
MGKPERRHLILILVLAGVAAATAAEAQDGTADPKKVAALLNVAFKYRREGMFDSAAAAYDYLIALPIKPEERRQAAFEAYDVATVQSKNDKAARLAHGVDLTKEALAMTRSGRGAQALKLVRDAKDALAEGFVLKLLGSDMEALEAFGRAGAPGAIERGELLIKVGRGHEAVKAFEASGDSFRRARAMEISRESAGTAWEAAKAEERTTLEGLLSRAKALKAQHEAAPAGYEKERARFALAEHYASLVDSYERFSVILEKTGDRPGAAKVADLTMQFAQTQRSLMTDSGADKFGVGLVKVRELDARDKRLEERRSALR